MTFKEIQDEVLGSRFKSSQRDSVKRWINHRYGWVWGSEAWSFRYAAPTNLTITAGSRAAVFATATDVRRVFAVYDQNGGKLTYVHPRAFFSSYQDPNLSGTAVEYTVLGGSILIGPTPQTSNTFTAPYEKKLTLMSADGNTPAWDEAYHYMLVMGAIATGLKVENDPSWEGPEDEFRMMLGTMLADLNPEAGENLAYGEGE